MLGSDSKRSDIFTIIKTVLLKAVHETLAKKEEQKVKRSLKSLEDSEKAVNAKNYKEAFRKLADAKYHLMETDAYRDDLVEAMDVAFDELWKLMNGKKGSISKVKQKLKDIYKLMEKPKGKKARRPAAVESARDTYLWETAKRIVRDEYPYDENDERYWKITTGILQRMKGERDD